MNAAAITESSSAQSCGGELDIRPMRDEDQRFAAATWRESFKESSASLLRTPWPLYKQTVGKQIEALLGSPTVTKIAAYAPDDRVIGWMAYSPGRSISTVHWTYTRHKLDEEKCRRRGVMTLLLDAAELGRRFAYTHHGSRRIEHRAHRGNHVRSPDSRPSVDLAIVDWLRTRGVTAVYVAIEEWLR